MNTDALTRILDQITTPSASFEGRHDTLMNAAMETGGTYRVTPTGHTTIDIHRIRVSAESEAEAHRLWLRAAKINGQKK